VTPPIADSDVAADARRTGEAAAEQGKLGGEREKGQLRGPSPVDLFPAIVGVGGDGVSGGCSS
jgi:hypothetical protein